MTPYHTPRLYILCGYPFAGKSTVARLIVPSLHLSRIALDDINGEQGVGDDVNVPITPEQWQKTYDIFHDRIIQTLKRGDSVIVDSVAYKRQNRDMLRELAKNCGAQAVILHVATQASVCRERWLKNRETRKRSDVRDENFNDVVDNFEQPTNDEDAIVITSTMTDQQVLNLVE